MSRKRKLPPDDEATAQWIRSAEYRCRADAWYEDFKAKGVAVPLDEAAASFAKTTKIDVPLAKGILRRMADPEGYARFTEERGYS